MKPPLVIVPARTCSRRIPGKNFGPIGGGLSPVQRALTCGRELLQTELPWLTTDRDAALLLSVFISSPSHYRRRPDYLGTDSASMVDVVLDVLERTDQDRIVLLQPTQPLRQLDDVRHALELLDQFPSVATVVETTPIQKCGYLTHGGFWYSVSGGPVERDQDSAPTYRCDGTAYAFRRDWFLMHRCFRSPETFCSVIDPAHSAPLDTPTDWAIADLRLRALESPPCPSTSFPPSSLVSR